MAYSKYNYEALDYVGFSSSYPNSYTGFGLVVQKVEVNPPQRETTIIKTSNGEVDITEAISSIPKYKNRKITITFKVLEAKKNWQGIYEEFCRQVNGEYFNNIYISSRKSHYAGRVKVDDYNTSEKLGLITVVIDAEPKSTSDQYEKIYLDFTDDRTKTIEIIPDENMHHLNSELLMFASGSYIKATVTYKGGTTSEQKSVNYYNENNKTTFGTNEKLLDKISFVYTGSSTPKNKHWVKIYNRREVIA